MLLTWALYRSLFGAMLCATKVARVSKSISSANAASCVCDWRRFGQGGTPDSPTTRWLGATSQPADGTPDACRDCGPTLRLRRHGRDGSGADPKVRLLPIWISPERKLLHAVLSERRAGPAPGRKLPLRLPSERRLLPRQQHEREASGHQEWLLPFRIPSERRLLPKELKSSPRRRRKMPARPVLPLECRWSAAARHCRRHAP